MTAKEYYVYPEADGIHIADKSHEISFIPASSIKTIVRADIFTLNQRYIPYYLPVMLITTYSDEELAKMSPVNADSLIDKSEITKFHALCAANEQIRSWRPGVRKSCVMLYTRENIRRVRSLFPAAAFNDLSTEWIYNS